MCTYCCYGFLDSRSSTVLHPCRHPSRTYFLPQLARGSSTKAFVSKHVEGINWLRHLALSTRLLLCGCHLTLSSPLLPLSPPLTFTVTASSCICFLLLQMSNPIDHRTPAVHSLVLSSPTSCPLRWANDSCVMSDD